MARNIEWMVVPFIETGKINQRIAGWRGHWKFKVHFGNGKCEMFIRYPIGVIK